MENAQPFVEMGPEAATRVWDDLTDRLDAFLAAWQGSESAPDLGSFLPTEPATLRRMALEELIKVDLEQRAHLGRLRSLDDYVTEFPELLVDGQIPTELIHEEIAARGAAGEQVDLRDYLRRYPAQASAIKRLHQISARTATKARVRREVLDAISVGEMLDEFELLADIGRGAFARVFMARQVSMGRLVALKISGDDGAEPQTLAQLDHPNIVRVYDQRCLPGSRLRLLYMQLIPGGTLQGVIQRARTFPPQQRTGAVVMDAIDAAMQRTGQLTSEGSTARIRFASRSWPEVVCRLGIQLAQALDYAHHRGVLHRDVKPANVLLTADAVPKLADFNVSFAADLPGATPDAFFGGSLVYMSPEQLEAGHAGYDREPASLDGRSDLYSLAVVLWELLHGERPFQDQMASKGWSVTLDQMLERRRSGDLQQPHDSIGGPFAERLRLVLTKALNADPDQRHQAGQALARELYLATQPRAWDFVADRHEHWRSVVGRNLIVVMLLTVMPPNMLGGAFNYWYNKRTIIDPLGEDAIRVFDQVQLVVNVVAFSAGALILLGVAWPLMRMLRRTAPRSDRSLLPSDQELAHSRRNLLRLGHLAAGVGIVEWLLAGIAFPVGMHWGLGSFPLAGYIHFFFSMLVCGAVAAAFPFFGTTDWMLARFYPRLLGQAEIAESERRQLSRLATHSLGYLFVASGVPLLGLMLMVGTEQDDRVAAMILIFAGMLGMVLAYVSHHRIRGHVATIAAVTRPHEAILTETESIDLS